MTEGGAQNGTSPSTLFIDEANGNGKPHSNGTSHSVLRKDPTRAILQPFEKSPRDYVKLFERIATMSDEQLEQTYAEYKKLDLHDRHPDFARRIEAYLQNAEAVLDKEKLLYLKLEGKRREIAAAYLCKEYTIEGSALFNPCILPHPEGKDEEGRQKILMSLRCVGEGHFSTIGFREGVIEKDGTLNILPDSGIIHPPSDVTKGPLNDEAIISYPEKSRLDERVLVPQLPQEDRGLEDVRFTRFEHNNGEITYYGVYVAYDGKNPGTHLIETKDFRTFDVKTMRGAALKDKGLGLFPRKVDGKYLMMGRIDGANQYLLESKDLLKWDVAKPIDMERESWELMQVGNCGAPIELKDELTVDGKTYPNGAWLVMTHSVGMARQYRIGAMLLDKEDPTKVIAKTMEPLYSPDGVKGGHVPNVSYSCGSMLHEGVLHTPVAHCDEFIEMKHMPLEKLLQKMHLTEQEKERGSPRVSNKNGWQNLLAGNG